MKFDPTGLLIVALIIPTALWVRDQYYQTPQVHKAPATQTVDQITDNCAEYVGAVGGGQPEFTTCVRTSMSALALFAVR
jgi:trans-aconitate methyltransferase